MCATRTIEFDIRGRCTACFGWDGSSENDHKHAGDAVIEMWRPNTDAWALRGHLDSVAATIIDGETASRLRQERLAGSRSREEPCLSIFLCLFYWKPGSNWRCRNIVCAMRDLPMPGSPEINTTQPSHDYVLI
jgi:hypothetical protein